MDTSDSSKAIDRWGKWGDCKSQEGVYSRSMQLFLTLCVLAVSCAIRALKDGIGGASSSTSSYVDPESYISEDEASRSGVLTLFEDIRRLGEDCPVLGVVGSFFHRLKVMSDDMLVRAIRIRLSILLSRCIPLLTQPGGELAHVLKWWMVGCEEEKVDEGVLNKLFPHLGNRWNSYGRHKVISESFSGLQFINDYTYSCLKIQHPSWSWKRRSKNLYYSIDNGSWSRIFAELRRPGISGEYGMCQGTFVSMTNFEVQGNYLEALTSFVLPHLRDWTSLLLIYALAIRKMHDPSYLDGIADYFQSVAGGKGNLRHLADPKSSTANEQHEQSWKENLSQVKHLIAVGALDEHRSGFSRLTNRAFCSQSSPLSEMSKATATAAVAERRSRSFVKVLDGGRCWNAMCMSE